MLAYYYPQQSLFWTMLEFFLFVIWIWILIAIFTDIFRSHDMSGWVKALWVIFVIVLPFLGILVYLIARGGKMQEHVVKDAAQQRQAFDTHVREVAGTSVTDDLAKLADLKEKGVLTDAEFQDQKAKLLG
jgi:hypothetical protein